MQIYFMFMHLLEKLLLLKLKTFLYIKYMHDVTTSSFFILIRLYLFIIWAMFLQFHRQKKYLIFNLSQVLLDWTQEPLYLSGIVL